MKHLLLILTLLFGITVSAQSTMNLYNYSSMDIAFNMTYYNTITCSYTGSTVYVVPANTTSIVTAPAGEEFVFAQLAPFPYCSPSFGASVSTPSVCNSSCPSLGSNYFVGTNGGCAGGLTTINVKWTDCGAPGEGYLTIIDF